MTSKTRKEAEKRVVGAATGKQWALLALWVEQGMPYPLMHSTTIVRDIRRLDAACRVLSKLSRRSAKGKK